MISKTTTCVAVIFMCGVVSGWFALNISKIPVASAQTTTGPAASEAGRFQFINVQTKVGYVPQVFDTSTGEVYKYIIDNPDSWKKMGSPAKAK